MELGKDESMYIKLMGAFMVILGCGGYGILMAIHHRKETAALHQLANVMDDMICELEYRMTPLPELCRFGASQSKGGVRSFFLALAKAMEDQISPDVGICTVAALKEVSGLPSHATAHIQALGQTLGRFDLPGQISAFERCKQACLAQLELLEYQQGQRLRSYQTLGFCAGTALAIILF